ncbi:uncharacterized protein AB675_3932 [Cyphellophora attinorum]|uniref:Putative membrane protein n=1 Tax=Cyphellophora attinorum TaxID=1664694 RepID=A0A0N1NWZ0_9EURO|nr:uncharacterized protein AB675_3932 [Phialophora attinorum]KPI37615.1 putative membrane protein [Phialophora attinorum]
MIICVLGCLLTWPILLPINATGGGDDSQLDKLAFGNVVESRRLYAHATIAWVFVGTIVLIITRERLFAISLRNAYATLRHVESRLSSKVVLFLSVPKDALDEERLQQFFGPSAVRSWYTPNAAEIEDLVSERASKIDQLESAELKLEKNVAKKARDSPQNGSGGGKYAHGTRPASKPYYVFGEDIDTIDKLRKEIPELEERIKSLRENVERPGVAKSGALFVEFKTQAEAQRALKSSRHHDPLAFKPRLSHVQPREVLWKNANIDPAARLSYSYLATAFIIATIILWSIPVGIVGTISNINYLTNKIHWLRWIDNLPDPILGILTGFVPPFILSFFVSYVPYFFRYIAKLSGQPTTVEAEKKTQHWYFAFQVIQVFLITTFSSGATTVATKIANEPGSIPVLLAKNLPKASNFYLSYFIIQGLGSAPKNVLNYSDLFQYIFYDKVFDRTPRQKYNRITQMKGIGWGSVYPKFANFAVIAIAYSCVAPLVLGFAAAGLYLFYISYRYQLLYAIQVKVEPRGQCYSNAMQHLMVGVYLAELCLLGLFSIKNAAGPVAMLAVLLVVTIVYHAVVNRYLSPLEKYLPLDELQSDNDEEQPLLADDNNDDEEDDEPRNGTRARIRTLAHKANNAIEKLPKALLDPLSTLLEPRLLPSVADLREWLSNPAAESSQKPLTEEEVKNAYINPALTAKMPKVWIPKDKNGLSAKEIEENEKVGVASTDEGAELDGEGRMRWDRDDFEKAPVFKLAKKY